MEFDPEVALAKAMGVFWSQGYEATSTTDLMSAMGLSKSSLYQTFGSKRELFVRCLDHYSDNSSRRLREKLDDADSGKQFLIDFFGRLINADGITPPG